MINIENGYHNYIKEKSSCTEYINTFLYILNAQQDRMIIVARMRDFISQFTLEGINGGDTVEGLEITTKSLYCMPMSLHPKLRGFVSGQN